MAPAPRRIAEIETLVIRNETAAKSLESIGSPRATWSQAVPAGQRHSRADLVRITNTYFSGIERNDGKGRYPTADSCARLENGARERRDRPRGVGVAPGAVRHGLRVEHVGAGDVERSARRIASVGRFFRRAVQRAALYIYGGSDAR